MGKEELPAYEQVKAWIRGHIAAGEWMLDHRQVLRADPKDGELALRLFRSNRTTGFLVFLGMLVVGLSSR